MNKVSKIITSKTFDTGFELDTIDAAHGHSVSIQFYHQLPYHNAVDWLPGCCREIRWDEVEERACIHCYTNFI